MQARFKKPGFLTALFAGAGLLLPNTIAAKPPIPSDQRGTETALWLARAMVAEAGFEAARDHAAIAHVLARRYQRAQQRWPELRFLQVVRTYCAGLGGVRRSLTPRQRWVRALDVQGSEPPGWPERLSWANHRPLWVDVLERATNWMDGGVSDPCAGRAWHWGGTIDTPRGRMVAIDCGPTLNTFYGLSAVDASDARASLEWSMPFADWAAEDLYGRPRTAMVRFPFPLRLRPDRFLDPAWL